MSLSAPVPHLLRFDSFELDTRTGELRKAGVRLRLHGQPIQLLTVLLQNAGSLVTREELKTELWPADTFVDFDHSLYNAVARIREVLGDSAETPRYIETVSRRGYRFIATVEEVRLEAPGPSIVRQKADAEPALPGKIRSRFLAMLPVLTLVILVCAVWLIPGASPRHRISAAPLGIHSIAVLPLQNLSGDPSQNYFVDGMTDELITDLSGISSLRVISRTSVMRYRDTKESLPEIAQELNVDSIVEGSVTRSGGRVRITAQLLRVSTDQNIWAHSYESDLGDVLKLQSDVAGAIAAQVQANLSPQQQARIRSAPTVSPASYDAYLRGRYLITTSYSLVPQLKEAKFYFQESIQKDPNFAPAYVGLADSYTYMALFGNLSPQQVYQPAEEALRKAMQLDPDLGEAHDTLGLLKWRFDWNWTGARQEFDDAIALAPSYECARADYAAYLGFTGQRAEALTQITKSRELNPGTSFDSTESGLYYMLRDYKSLIESSRKGVASDPNDWLDHFFLGTGYEGSGNPAKAIPEYQRAIALSSGDQDATAALAHAYAVIGKRADAEKILRELKLKSKTVYVSPYTIATIYAGLGDKDSAFEFLEKAYHEKALGISWALKSDLRIDNLRSDPRFQSLARQIAFPNE